MNRVFIIAEAGVNHNGSLDIAKKLIDAATDAGADAVKFQTFRAEKMTSKYAPKAEYQRKMTDAAESQVEMLKKLQFDRDAHMELLRHCGEKNIIFMSTPFDFESIALLNDLGLEIFKIPSGEITNLPYLRKIGDLKKKVILSTGMADMGEIEAALDILTKAGTLRDNITVLHSTTEYPASPDDVNLSAMLTMRNTFKVKVGYSDHTEGIEIPVAAAALGASVIEKHFTLDRNMPGPDHNASIEPLELKKMIRAVRNVEKALGDGIKKPSASEMKNIPIVRKSIVAAKNIRKGEVFTEGNITVKRPGTGISPMEWDRVLGAKSPRDFEEDELIEV